MLVPINIDVSSFAQEFAIPEQEIKQFTSNIISELSIEFARYWENAASELNSTRQEYQNSIYTEKIDDYNYIVGLNGFLPNAIEQGMSAFDMKEGFKKSDKAHMKKDGGWYLTIPFRFSTPEAIGESSVFQNKMPSEVYNVAKGLQEGESIKKSDIKGVQGALPKKKVSVPKSKIFEEYQRKHSIYEGIQRKQDNKGRGQYVSFRRVSDNSDSDSWIHSGIEAHNLAEKAFDNMDLLSTVDAIVDKYIDAL